MMQPSRTARWACHLGASSYATVPPCGIPLSPFPSPTLAKRVMHTGLTPTPVTGPLNVDDARARTRLWISTPSGV